MGLIAHVAAGHRIVALTGPAASLSIVPVVLPLLRCRLSIGVEY